MTGETFAGSVRIQKNSACAGFGAGTRARGLLSCLILDRCVPLHHTEQYDFRCDEEKEMRDDDATVANECLRMSVVMAALAVVSARRCR